jgi:hypothetical protein
MKKQDLAFAMPETFEGAMETIASLRERLTKVQAALAAFIRSSGARVDSETGVVKTGITIDSAEFKSLPRDYSIRFERSGDWVDLTLMEYDG